MALLAPKKTIRYLLFVISGKLIVTDPCYLNSFEALGSAAVSFNTEIGDGEFAVYEERDKRGRLRRIVIEID